MNLQVQEFSYVSHDGKTSIAARKYLPEGDEDTAAEIVEILKQSAHQMNKCVVVVTHSGELAKQADVVLTLRKGGIQIFRRQPSNASAMPDERRSR